MKSRHLQIIVDTDFAVDLLALKVRPKLSPRANLTGLHSFVTTLRCEQAALLPGLARERRSARIRRDRLEHLAPALRRLENRRLLGLPPRDHGQDAGRGDHGGRLTIRSAARDKRPISPILITSIRLGKGLSPISPRTGPAHHQHD